jgi:hypothetical protein
MATNSPPQPPQLRSGGAVINENIAKPPPKERTEWRWSTTDYSIDQHHPVCGE